MREFILNGEKQQITANSKRLEWPFGIFFQLALLLPTPIYHFIHTDAALWNNNLTPNCFFIVHNDGIYLLKHWFINSYYMYAYQYKTIKLIFYDEFISTRILENYFYVFHKLLCFQRKLLFQFHDSNKTLNYDWFIYLFSIMFYRSDG